MQRGLQVFFLFLFFSFFISWDSKASQQNFITSNNMRNAVMCKHQRTHKAPRCDVRQPQRLNQKKKRQWFSSWYFYLDFNSALVTDYWNPSVPVGSFAMFEARNLPFFLVFFYPELLLFVRFQVVLLLLVEVIIFILNSNTPGFWCPARAALTDAEAAAGPAVCASN